MICSKCGKPTYRFKWLHNERVCDVCLHNSRPATHRDRDVEDKDYTWADVKKYLERHG